MQEKVTFQGAVLLLLSTAALMALHLLQGGIPCLIIPYLLILGYIYRTKQDKRLQFSAASKSEYILIGVVILFSISCGEHFREFMCIANTDFGYENPRVLVAPVLGTLGILSIPILVYILSWFKECGSSGYIERISSALNRRSFFKLCAGISLLAIASELYFSCSKSISWDESFSLSIVDSGYDKVIHVTSIDVHPPLYYLILKGISDTLCSLSPHISAMQAAKIASTLPCILLLILCLTWVRKHWGNCVAGLSALTIICTPPLLEYAVTVRMYSWATLFVICCYVQAWRVMRKNTIINWLIFAAFGLLSVYTHYWGGIAVSAIYVYMGFWSIRRGKRSILKWCMAAVLSVVGYLPWLAIWVTQYHDAIEGGHTLRTLWSHLTNVIMFAQDNTLMFFTVAVCILFSFRATRSGCSREERFGYLGLSVLAVTLILSLTGVFLSSILLYLRLFIPATMCAWLGTGILISRQSAPRLRAIAAVVIVSTCACSLIAFCYREYKEQCAAEQLISLCKPGATVFYATDQDFSHTIFQLCDADSFSCKSITPVMRQVYDKNPFYKEQSADLLHAQLRSGKEVFYIARDRHDAKKYGLAREPECEKFTARNACVLRDCGAYRLRWYIWHLYRVELPSESADTPS